MYIRWMIRRDMSAVLPIEEQSFEFPWTEEEFIRLLRQRNCIGMVVENDSADVVGFMVYELHKNRLHLLNMAVAPNFRGQGYGKAMVEKLISKLSDDRRTRIRLVIRETNLPGQQFLRHMGFVAVSITRDFYEETTEDAYVMQYRYASDALVAGGIE